MLIQRPCLKDYVMKCTLLFAATTIAIFLGLVSTAWTAEKATTPVKPNIVLIVADDQGYNDLGCLNGEIQTPNLDRLAKEGVRLTNYYVTWPACTPSRGSILTGRYPQRNGLYDMIRNDMVNYGHHYTPVEYAISPEMTLGLDVREITVAQILRQAGYATGIVGKWDSGRAKRFLPLATRLRFLLRFCQYRNRLLDARTLRHPLACFAATSRSRSRVTPPSCSAAKRSTSSASITTGPSFFISPSTPRIPAPTWKKTGGKRRKNYIRKYPGCDPSKNRTKYMAMVTCMDDAIGAVLATLKELGIG